MKKRIILLPLVGLLIYLVMSSYSGGPGNGGTGDRTGASGVNGCFGGTCHGSSTTPTTSTTISLQLLDGGTPVTSYIASHNYVIRITGTNTSTTVTNLSKFGFQVCMVNTGTTTSVGTLSTTGISSVAHLGTYSGISIVEHGPSALTGSPYVSGSGGTGTTYTIDVPWTSPSSGGGCATIHCVLNAVNASNSADAGDKWNTALLNIAGPVSAITGTLSTCLGASTSLSTTTTGGTWSTTPGTGSVTLSPSGSTVSVTGGTAGTATVTYTTSCGGTASATVTVNAAPNITGTATVCAALTTTLSATPSGGTWSSGSPGIATVGASSGVVSGGAPGTAVITYTSTSGCTATRTVTVNPPPATITGTAGICVGSTTTLSSTTSGGTWTSGTTSVATIGATTATTAVVNGVTTGTSVITYTSASGCTTTQTVTVNGLPTAITGTLSLCPSATSALASTPSGGTWTSGSPGIASISTGGFLSGVSAGNANITYTLSTGCSVTAVATINAAPATLTGASAVCVGGTTTYSSATTGGTWTSGNTSVATIGATTSTSATINGVAAGTSVISYTLPSSGCVTVRTVSVNNPPGTITGTLSVCQGGVRVLSCTPPGGTWSSSDLGIATVDGSGSVTGIAAGNAIITYTVGTGCFSTTSFTVNPIPPVGSITGPATVCAGSTVTESSATPGGVWAVTGLTGTATIGSATGDVTGVGAGTIDVTYVVTNSSGCSAFATRSMTVNALPTVSGGSGIAICEGTPGALTASGASTYTWSPATGLSCTTCTTPVVNPTITTTYTITGTTAAGCVGTATVTASVNPLPAGITGSTGVCVGSTTTLSSLTSGGTWTSSSPGIALIGSSSGTVTGIINGVATISYTLPTGCRVTRVQTVNPLPAPIGGASVICEGATITLLDGTAFGTWSSSAPATAAIGGTTSTSAIINGIAAGTADITYTMPATGCFVTKPITVNPTPVVGPITGAPGLCVGSTTSLSNSATGGTWSSTGSSSIATVGSSTGIVTGIGAGTANVTYVVTTGSCSASATLTVTVHPLPATITGTMSVCAGSNRTLSDATAGGTWTSNDLGVATVGSSSGVVTGVAGGTTVITYTLGTGCFRTTTFTVNASPSAISGTPSVCVGETTALGNTMPGGTWTSSNPAQASIGATSGVVTGMVAGTPTITYTLPGGCFVTQQVTVNPLTATSILSSLCAGSSGTLTNPTPGGTWTSGSPSVATVGATTGFVSALTPGVTVITYTLPSGCAATRAVTVVSAPSPIAGSTSMCVGTTTTLSNSGGGVWTSTNPLIASIGSSSGVVTGNTAGVVIITYSLGSGCTITAPMSVNPNPAPISGFSTACVGATISLFNGTPGGTWSSSSSGIASIATTGVVTGMFAGSATITYTLASSCFSTKTVTINALPATIAGLSEVCAGSSIVLTNATSGGTWTSLAPGIATVGATTGIAAGVAAGTATIRYTITSTTCSTTKIITVNPIPAVITGTTNVCVGATTTLADATGGGIWTSSNPAVADIGSTTGLVSGVAAGIANITYALPTGCFRMTVVTVNAIPVVSPVIGAGSLCEGAIITLASPTTGGIWTSSNPAIALIGATSGIVTGVSSGTATITYTVTIGGCATAVTHAITVHPSPSIVTGPGSVCAGASITLADAIPGGTWSSSPTVTGTIDGGTGVFNGLVAGVATITYTLSGGCMVTKMVTVNPLPVAGTIAGPTSVCAGSGILLTNTAGGGVWASVNATIATVGTSSGVVTGVAAGVDTILYSVTNVCGTATTTYVVTVNPLPNAGVISSSGPLCLGGTHTLSTTGSGGTWSSDNVAIATVGSVSGVVSGVAIGMTTISYITTNMCGTAATSRVDTVRPMPNAGAIVGTDSICVGETVTLTNLATGGTWSASNTRVTVGSASGVVTGVSTGAVTISYSVTTVCGTATATLAMTVLPHGVCFVGVQPVANASEGPKVYPNPSGGTFTIELPEHADAATITVTDALGKTVETATVAPNELKTVIKLDNVAAGNYMLRINSGSNTWRQKLVIW